VCSNKTLTVLNWTSNLKINWNNIRHKFCTVLVILGAIKITNSGQEVSKAVSRAFSAGRWRHTRNDSVWKLSSIKQCSNSGKVISRWRQRLNSAASSLICLLIYYLARN